MREMDSSIFMRVQDGDDFSIRTLGDDELHLTAGILSTLLALHIACMTLWISIPSLSSVKCTYTPLVAGACLAQRPPSRDDTALIQQPHKVAGLLANHVQHVLVHILFNWRSEKCSHGNFLACW